jgi:hypothetical protein
MEALSNMSSLLEDHVMTDLSAGGLDMPMLEAYQVVLAVPRAQKKETQARANCSAVLTQLALCLRLAIDL